MEGELLPTLTADDRMAFRVAHMLSTGMGGIDWAGLPIVAGWLGIGDIDGLLHRLSVILTHEPNRKET